MGVNAADLDNALGAVDVAALEGDPLLRPKACPHGEERDGGEAGIKLLGDRLHLEPVGERGDLWRLRFWVGDVAGGRLLDPLPPDRLV